MAIKNYVKDNIVLLKEQIEEAKESIKVLQSLGRPTTLEVSQIERAEATLKNLTEYVESE